MNPIPMSTGVRIAPVVPADGSPLQRQLLEPVFGDRAANVFATLVAHPALFEPTDVRERNVTATFGSDFRRGVTLAFV